MSSILFMIIFLSVAVLFIVGTVQKKNHIVSRISGTVLLVFGLLFCTFLASLYMGISPLGSTGLRVIWILSGDIFLISLLFIWKPLQIKPRRVLALLLTVVFLVYAAADIGIKLYDDSQDILPQEDIHLGQYRPFSENSLLKSLTEPSSLHFEGNLPNMDGATALYPLYAAFAQATYPQGVYDVYEDAGYNTAVRCSKSSEAYSNLLDGRVDVIFVKGVSKEQQTMANAQELTLEMTPIGREAFVFFVNRHNTILNLTTEQVKDIYSGRITNWKEVGGKNDVIRAYQRPEGSGSQTALLEIMGDIPLADAPQEDIYDLMDGMYSAVASYRNYRNSLGYSFRYYLTDMIGDNTIRLLSINGIAPSVETIVNNTYPYAGYFYAITVARSQRTEDEQARYDNAKALIDWILSDQGQYLVEETGYVPVI